MRAAFQLRSPRVAWSLVALIAVQACSDRIVEPVDPVTTPVVGAAQTRLDCVADVIAATVACSSAKSGANTSLILGGQGTYVRITSDSVSYNSTTHQFRANLAVQNLTAQRLGTLDGTTVTGIDLFINSGPFGSGGTVSVITPSTTATFTASGQRYMHYPEILDVFGGTSAPHTWIFDVPTNVPFFVFSVLVSAPVQDDVGPIRWEVERGYAGSLVTVLWGADSRNVFGFGQSYTGVSSFDRFDGVAWHTMLIDPDDEPEMRAMWGSSPSDVWVVGNGGVIGHYNGKGWTSFPDETPDNDDLTSVWGSGPNDVYAVGPSTSLHWNGTAWQQQDIGGDDVLNAIYGTAPNNIWAVGEGGIILHYDGSIWSAQASGTSSDLFGVYAAGTEAWAVGFGVPLHFSGGAWAATTGAPPSLYNGISGSSATNVWISSISGLFKWTGSAWTNVPTPGIAALYPIAIWTGGPNDVWISVVGANYSTIGVPYHWDGATWSIAGARPDYSTLYDGSEFFAVFGVTPTDVWAVGSDGLIVRNLGDGWKQVGPRERDLEWFSVWGSGPNDVWIGGDAGLRHWNGTAMSATIIGCPSVGALWGFASDDIVAGCEDGSLWHYDGETWNNTRPGGPYDEIRGLWGAAPHDIWAAGPFDSMLHWDGSSWDQVSIDLSVSMQSVHGTSSANVVAVGDEGIVIRWDGETWVQEVTPTTQLRLNSVFSDSDPNHMIAVGERGSMLRHTAAGWISVVSGTTEDLLGVWLSSMSNAYIVGSADFIARGRR